MTAEASRQAEPYQWELGGPDSSGNGRGDEEGENELSPFMENVLCTW